MWNFTIENLMEHLFYAESENCALLKEVTMDFIVQNNACSRSFDHRCFAAMSRGIYLRRELCLTVDGSREMLIAALEVLQN